MPDQTLAIHETMEIHELLTFKNVCRTKSVTLQVLVSDERLKGLLQTCADVDALHIADLQGLLMRGAEARVQ